MSNTNNQIWNEDICDQLSWDSEPGAERGESYLSCHPRPASRRRGRPAWPDVKVGSLPVDRDKLVARTSLRDDPVKT